MSDEMKNRLTFYAVGFFILCMGVLLWVLPARAQVQQVLICDTAEQVETIYTAFAAKIPMEEVVEAVNKAAGASACGVAAIVAHPIEMVKTIKLNGREHIIIKIAVVAVFNGVTVVPVNRLEQFSIMIGKEDASV